jgi:phospholipid-binding lipoprotein MlaA
MNYSFIAIILLFLSGCSSMSSTNNDPYENWNRKSYELTMAVDKAIIKPIAKGTTFIVPDFIEMGIRNVLSNLGDIPNSFNNLLQGKPIHSFSDLGRFLINSTLGIFGFFDPASEMGLIKYDEDFGQTLAVWGVSEGPFLWIPLLGPSTLRGAVSLPIDSHLNPINQINHIRTRNTLMLTKIIDKRASLLSLEEQIKLANDPYLFIRDAYLQNRKYKIYDGELPITDEDCDDEDCDF